MQQNNEPSSKKKLKQETKLQKIKTKTTIIEKPEVNEDEVYERIKDSRFKQQRLKAWRPVPTVLSLVIAFSVFGIIFIILGIILLIYSKKVKNEEVYYEDCELDTICNKTIEIKEDIEKPVFIYYQLDGFYQNARRYLKSKNSDQLYGNTDEVTDCEPAVKNKDMEFGDIKSIAGTNLTPNANAIPCGLLAKTFFNDTYNFSINNETIIVDETDISFAKDRDLHKENKYPEKQWQDLTDEHFLVWIRPSGLPNPRKLWGKIDRDLKSGDKINIEIHNNYNSSAYKGKKKIVLNNATVFGGKNKFLGISYIVVGCLAIICAIIFPIGYRFQLGKEKHL